MRLVGVQYLGYVISSPAGHRREVKCMHPISRRTPIMLLTCVVIVLIALACPASALAQQTFSIDFPKRAGLPNSCMTQEKAGSGGMYLRCRIVLPADVPSTLFIRAVFFECRPRGSEACRNTQQCPGNGAVWRSSERNRAGRLQHLAAGPAGSRVVGLDQRRRRGGSAL